MKISGRVVSTKPISLNRAAKLISRFAAVENGSSPAVSIYLQRTSDAFNRLVQSHDKRCKTKNLNSLDSKNIRTEKESENVARESENEIINDVKSDGDAAVKKKKKRRKSGEAEKSSSKKSRDEAID